VNRAVMPVNGGDGLFATPEMADLVPQLDVAYLQ